MSNCLRIVADSGDKIYVTCSTVKALECLIYLYHPTSHTFWEYSLGVDDIASSSEGSSSTQGAFDRLQAVFEPLPDHLKTYPAQLAQFHPGKGMLQLEFDDQSENMTLYFDAVDTPSSVMSTFLDASIEVQKRVHDLVKALETQKQAWKEQFLEQQEQMALLNTQCSRSREELFRVAQVLLNDKKHEIERLRLRSNRENNEAEEEKEVRGGDSEDSDKTREGESEDEF